MSDQNIDPETLQDEIGQIKEAMGLQSEYPYWWRFWIVEGIGVGLLFPLMQLGLNDGFSWWLTATAVGVFLGHQFVLWRIQKAYDRPTSGIPSWDFWHYIIFASLIAAIIGMRPLLGGFEGDVLTLWLVIVGSLMGMAYLYMGQLLEAYNIRRVDRYAFYVGGGWILALVAAIPHISALENAEFAVFGVGYALYCLVAYVTLSRRY
ncbi:hypothetical protein [Halostagnicola bangensis]